MHTTPHQLGLFLGLLGRLTSSSPLVDPRGVETGVTSASSSNSLLTKRDYTELVCGFYSTADRNDAGSGIGTGGDRDVPIAANSCNRVGCYDTSGVYVCNDQAEDINVPLYEIIDHMNYLDDACGTGRVQGKGISGRVKVSDYGGYNVNIAYCNGNHPPSSSPADYSSGWPGPNGEPKIQCGKDGQNPCEGTGCKEGTIVVESQEDADCGDYLGSTYVTTGSIYQYSTTRTIGETWTVGGFLVIDSSDLAPVSVQAGFFSSFAKTTTTGSLNGFSKTCGEEGGDGNFTCAAFISPKCLAMTGYCETEETGRAPWAVIVPKTGEDGQGVWSGDLCMCTNCQYYNPGTAPEPCTLECLDCPSGDI